MLLLKFPEYSLKINFYLSVSTNIQTLINIIFQPIENR